MTGVIFRPLKDIEGELKKAIGTIYIKGDGTFIYQDGVG